MTPTETCRAIRCLPPAVRTIAAKHTDEARRYWKLQGIDGQQLLAAQVAALEVVLIQEGALAVEGWRT